MFDSTNIQALPNYQYLVKEFREQRLIELITPELAWLDFMPAVKADGETISAIKMSYDAANDPLKRMPPPHASGARFVKVGVSDLEEIHTTLAENGLEVDISERAMRRAIALDEIEYTYKRVAQWVAEWVDTKITSVLMDANRGVTRVASGMKFYDRDVIAWGETGSNPVSDLIDFGYSMKMMRKGHKMTDAWVSSGKFLELIKFLTNLDVSQDTREALFGTGKASLNTIYIPVADLTVHESLYALADGDILGLDARTPPTTRYFDFNPKYSPTREVRLESGQTLNNNFGLHTHMYESDESHDSVLQIWLETGFLTKYPDAGLFCPAGAKGI